MVIPARGWGQEGARAGITIFAFSRPKSSKMVIPARGCEGTGNTRENHHFSIFNSQILQNRNSRAVGGGGARAGITSLAFSRPKSFKIVIPARGGGGGAGGTRFSARKFGFANPHSWLENRGLQTPFSARKWGLQSLILGLKMGVCKPALSSKVVIPHTGDSPARAGVGRR